VVMLLNRSITPAEYGPIWDALNHLLGCGFDEHGRSPALCYGGHARRSADAPYKRRILDGAALDADALLDFGRSLRSPPSSTTTPKANGGRRSLIEEIERSRLLGSVLPPDRYGIGSRAPPRSSVPCPTMSKERFNASIPGRRAQGSIGERSRRGANSMKCRPTTSAGWQTQSRSTYCTGEPDGEHRLFWRHYTQLSGWCPSRFISRVHGVTLKVMILQRG